jgi:hypothetical protein
LLGFLGITIGFQFFLFSTTTGNYSPEESIVARFVQKVAPKLRRRRRSEEKQQITRRAVVHPKEEGRISKVQIPDPLEQIN